jgi:predicted metal-dependent hydrolase
MTTSSYTSGPTPLTSARAGGHDDAAAPAVEVVRSTRRRKTVSARLVNGVVRVSIPARMSKQDEAKWVGEMLRRFERRRHTEEVDLAERAARLAARYGLRVPGDIRWADNQHTRWGSCSPGPGTVRVSSVLAREPAWVLDYVIVHELAHLEVAAHNKAFWAIVARYPLAERARGFLMARGMEGLDAGDDAEQEDRSPVPTGLSPAPNDRSPGPAVAAPGRARAGRRRHLPSTPATGFEQLVLT